MFATTTSATLVGARPRRLDIQAHVGPPREAFCLVGLPDTAVREAKDRVRAAMASASFAFPHGRVTVNLAPADLPKAGSAYDLPIALGLLAAAGLIPEAATNVVALGELALDGTVQPARGAVAAAIVAAGEGLPCLVPEASADQAQVVDGVDIRPVRTLAGAVAAALRSPREPSGTGRPSEPRIGARYPDMADVRGQPMARRAVEIAAAGGHHLLLTGPPGSGKSMLAKRLPGLLPRLSPDQVVETLCVWEAADRHRPDPILPPFCSPHHTASGAALLGGGSGYAVPGQISLAHHGVLFLDELGEFPAVVLDALRQPIEDGWIDIARRGVSVRYPARTQVVAATNPCPCGYRGDHLQGCRCADGAVERYRRRLSGPLLDRFDLRVWVGRPERLDGPLGEPSVAVAARVSAAVARQRGRGVANRDLPGPMLDSMPYSTGAVAALADACSSGVLNGRGYDRVRRVALTIADLAGRDEIVEGDVAEASAFRGGW